MISKQMDILTDHSVVASVTTAGIADQHAAK